jgi:Domain of unknown function (DUF932)
MQSRPVTYTAKASWGIPHTGGARAAIQEARNALKLSWRYIDAFETEAAWLYAQPMDTDQRRPVGPGQHSTARVGRAPLFSSGLLPRP